MYTDDNNYGQDNYEQNNGYDQEEEVKEERQSFGSNKKLIYIIIGIIVLAIIIFAVVKIRQNKILNGKYTVRMELDPITVGVGMSTKIPVKVTNVNKDVVKNPKLAWQIDNETIASINDGEITGLSLGKTYVTAAYTNNAGKKYEDMKEVTVYEGDYNTTLTNVSIGTGDLYMPLNSTHMLVIELTPPNGRVEKKVFTSQNTEVVTVDKHGMVTAIGEGQTTITININDQFNKELKVYVNKKASKAEMIVNPTRINITSEITSVKIGEMQTIEYTIEPADASRENITFTSSDPEVLLVDSEGKIKGIKEGSAMITIEAPNNTSAMLAIQVVKPEILVTEIKAPGPDISIAIGQNADITPEIIPGDATDKTLSFVSDNDSIMSVVTREDGEAATVTGIAAGNATLTITANNNPEVQVVINFTVVDLGGGEEVDYGGGGGSSSGSSGSRSYKCKAGQYKLNGKCVSCPAGKGSPAGSTTAAACTPCAKGYYSTGDGKGCIACPGTTTTVGTGATSSNSCRIPSDIGCSIQNCATYAVPKSSDNCKCTKCKTNYTISNGGRSCVYSGSSSNTKAAQTK